MFSFFKREENLLDNNNIYNNMSKVLNNTTLNDAFKVTLKKYDVVGKLFEASTDSEKIEYMTMELFDKQSSKRYEVRIKEFEDVGCQKYDITAHYNTFKMALQKKNKNCVYKIKPMILDNQAGYDIDVEVKIGDVVYYAFEITMMYVDNNKIEYSSCKNSRT